MNDDASENIRANGPRFFSPGQRPGSLVSGIFASQRDAIGNNDGHHSIIDWVEINPTHTARHNSADTSLTIYGTHPETSSSDDALLGF
jgi:hypothetical protein